MKNPGLILLSLLSPAGPVMAREIAPVLRGRALEIVDHHGKLWAQIIVQPASTMPEGSGISLAGGPERKEWSGVQILAKGTGSSLKLTNNDGRETTDQAIASDRWFQHAKR